MEYVVYICHGGRDEMGVLIELHPEEGDALNVLKKARYILKQNKAVIAAYWQVGGAYIVARVPDPEWRLPPDQALGLVEELLTQSRISINHE